VVDGGRETAKGVDSVAGKDRGGLESRQERRRFYEEIAECSV
jgi:hypothetical protein